MSSPDNSNLPPLSLSRSLRSAKPGRGDLSRDRGTDSKNGGLETAAPWEEAPSAPRLVWILILTTAVISATFALSCVTPFAALAVALAGTVGLRASLRVVTIVWFANQVIGFVFFHFPVTANTFLWAVAIGLAALVTTIVAAVVMKYLASVSAPLRLGAVLLISFAVYEITLLPAAVLLDGLATFRPLIVAQLAWINMAALIAMVVLNEIAAVFLKPWCGRLPRLARAS